MTEYQFKQLVVGTLTEQTRAIGQIAQQLDEIKEHLEDQDAGLDAFANSVGERFEQVDSRLDKLEIKVDLVYDWLNQVLFHAWAPNVKFSPNKIPE